MTYTFYSCVIAQICNPIPELVTPIGLPTKEAKVEIEMYPVMVEVKIRKCSICQKCLFCSFYSTK